MGIAVLIFIVYIAIIVAFTIGYYRIIERKPIPTTTHHFISVVICLRNEEDNVVPLFDSLQKQNYSPEYFEVIAINDHSTDSTLNKLNMLHSYGFSITVISLDDVEGGKKAALFAAIKRAKGNIIATTDADCRLPQGWLSIINEHFCNRAEMVCGPVAYTPTGTFEHITSIEFGSLVASGIGAAGVGNPIYCNGANLAFKKELFFAANLHADVTPSGDDVFLLHYAKESQRNIAFAFGESSTVTTYADKNISELINRRVRWGSKTPYYTDAFTKFVATIVLLVNITVIILAITSCFSPYILQKFIILFGIKTACDYTLLAVHFRISGIKGWIKYFLPTMALYPFYITFTAFASLRNKFTWKERQYS